MDTKTFLICQRLSSPFILTLDTIYMYNEQPQLKIDPNFVLLFNATIKVTAQVISSNCIQDKVNYGLKFWDNFSGCGLELDKTV